MSKRDVPFYATEDDIRDLCCEVALIRKIQFWKYELSNEPKVIVFEEPIKLQKNNIYFISDCGKVIKERSIPQRSGGIKYTADLMINEDAICIHMGGLFNDNKLLQGQIGTGSESLIAQELDMVFRKIIKKKYIKIKSHYVGNEACKLLDSGLRLCPTNKSPELYDLKR